jgi:hypothetical protein
VSFEEWKRLLSAYHVLGVKVHDARLVSVMLAAGIAAVITLNESDFRRFSEVSVVTPADILAQQH